MNKTKLLSVMSLLAALALAFSVSSAQAENPKFDMFLYLIRGPIRTNNISDPRYDAWAASKVSKLYTNRTLIDEDVGYRLNAEHISQMTPMRTNETIHAFVNIVARGTNELNLKMLRFSQKSSDPANSLANSYVLNEVTNLIYSPKAWGITHGPLGPRTSDSIDTIGNGGINVKEICFSGMQSVYYTYSDQAGYNNISNYVNGFNVNFKVTYICEVVDSATNVLGRAQRTLLASGAPMNPILSITDIHPNVSVGFNMDTNVTLNLYSKPKMPGAAWNFEGTFNANDTLTHPKHSEHYFRAVLQPGSL